MSFSILAELLDARSQGVACALVTVASTQGSVPRQAGTKMIVYASGKISGTIGGGKAEALIIQEALRCLETGKIELKRYPLREGEPDSFGAICGGEMTLLIEPQRAAESIYLFGAGHCAAAIARLARSCELNVFVIEDREDILNSFEPANQKRLCKNQAEFVSKQNWIASDAILLVNRNYVLDRDTLKAILGTSGYGYVGMIGSKRKVLKAYDELRAQGVSSESLSQVHAPLGIDIGADSPEEIAISVMAEVLAVLRKRSGKSMRVEAQTSPGAL
ncbi:MAG: XdhC family protein [Verrucomicrobia bacterium]|nr:XdhC family protein [Verrucomicrobiota bacterium]